MMETSGHNNMCRCCASEGAFKDIKSTYHWMGEEEIYADMLKECFDISLNVSEHGEDGGICEVCITQLRNAINFKKQVQHTEEQFKKHLQNKAMFRPHIVKVEVVAGDEDSDGDNIGSGDDTFSGAEFEVPIKTENDDPKPKKRSKGMAASTRSKQSKTTTDDGETSTKRTDPESVLIEIEVDTSVFITEDEEQNVSPLTEVDKHRENIRTILLATNATPIGRYGSLGYTCCYCPEVFSAPQELKKHTIEEHGQENISSYMNNYTMLNYIVKLDITNLRCEMCMTPFEELHKIVDHLASVHEKFFHKDISNHIVPFRFDSDMLRCVECSFAYNNFKILLEHMNSHYSNHICDFCKAGFVNRRMLQAHMYRHKTGVFTCGVCAKVFDTRIKMKVHERMVHMYLKKRPKCTICEQKFNDFESMIQHETESHGFQREFHCETCKKVFGTQRSFLMHKKLYCTPNDLSF